MGLLIDGKWHDQWYDTKSTGGKFVRSTAQFRNFIGEEDFPAETNRYHLYISLACPWACRVLTVFKLKKLEPFMSLSVVNPYMLENGWTFADGPGVIPDPIIDADYLHQIYTLSNPEYTGRVTVPVLFDKKKRVIVNNESSDIIRMFNTVFDDLGAAPGDFYPESLRVDIDKMNDFIYPTINNGVYKVGFATDQTVYEEELHTLFDALDTLEQHFATHTFLVGEQLTEADIRLFTTLVRFDAVYVGHFKCNLKRLIDYPNLWAYTKRLYHLHDIHETVDFYHIKHHYYGSHPTINPNKIVPTGPLLDWTL